MKETRHQPPLGQLWNSIQSWLFPMLEDEAGELDEKHRLFIAVCELCAPRRITWAPIAGAATAARLANHSSELIPRIRRFGSQSICVIHAN
jgi:hypothetical protein